MIRKSRMVLAAPGPLLGRDVAFDPIQPKSYEIDERVGDLFEE
jgi:hypothetical protein